MNYSISKIELKDDYEGRVEATLVKAKAITESDKGILYVHGYNDYFYQHHMAAWANQTAYNFYALDMRKYGRSILPHQKPNMFRDVTEYFEELDLAVETMRAEGNKKIILLGHSTGGLVATIYAHQRASKNIIDALVLNSPYFENNAAFLTRKLGVPVISTIGKFFPDAYMGIALEDGFAKSIHSSYEGEWDFDLELKPIKSFPLTFGWMRGLHKAQKQVHRGLDIGCPVLVLYSSKSVAPGKFNEQMHTADAVLNVKHIEKYANKLGKNVTKSAIDGGKHDLSLSVKEARNTYFQLITDFLEKI